MRTTKAISITLPHDMLALVRAKVRSGHYASESEVVRDGLRTLLARDAAVERWLEGEVVRSYDAYAADPATAIPIEDVLPRMQTRRGARAGPED